MTHTGVANSVSKYPKPLQQPQFMSQHTATAHLSQLTNMVPDIALFFITRFGVESVLNMNNGL
jgi:hypothetical protein